MKVVGCSRVRTTPFFRHIVFASVSFAALLMLLAAASVLLGTASVHATERRPNCVIRTRGNAQAASTHTTRRSIRMIVDFSEPVRRFIARDIQVEGASVNELSARRRRTRFIFKLDTELRRDEPSRKVTVRIPGGAGISRRRVRSTGCGPYEVVFVNRRYEGPSNEGPSKKVPSRNPTPVPTMRTVPTTTPLPRATLVPSSTPIPVPTSTHSPVPSPTPTATPTSTATATPQPTVTVEPTSTPTEAVRPQEQRCVLSTRDGVTKTTERSMRAVLKFSSPVPGFTVRDVLIDGDARLNEFGQKGFTYEFNVDVEFGKDEASREITVSIADDAVMSNGESAACQPLTLHFMNPRHVEPTSTPRAAPTPSATQAPSMTPTPRVTATPRAIEPTAAPTATPTAPATPTASPTPTATTEPESSGELQPQPPTYCDPNASVRRSMQELPIMPNAQGFGTTTVAGSGRHLATPCTSVYRVTNLRDRGEGTLRTCLEASGPRVCIFEVGGLIWVTKEIRIRNPYLTVAGQTAPSPGIVLRGSGITIEASDVLVQHLHFRVGDDPRDPCCSRGTCSTVEAQFCTQDPTSRDGIRVITNKSRPISNIVIDHVSISWALDEGFSVAPYRAPIENITFSNSIVSTGLDESIHPEASDPKDPGHSKGVLINGDHQLKNFSFHRNLLAHNAERNIRIASPVSMEFVNNVIYNWGRGRGSGRLLELTNNRQALHRIDLIGNTYKPGPDSFCPETLYRPELCNALPDGIDTEEARRSMHSILRVGSGVSAGLREESQYFLRDNFGPTREQPADDEWDVADKRFFTSASRDTLVFPNNRARTAVSASGSVLIQEAQEGYAHVLANAGARPGDRDMIDLQVIDEVAQGEGRIINCVAADGSSRCEKNAGGWPYYGYKTRRLNLPSRPHQDDDGDGYTNLEQWLHALAASIE